MIEIIEPVGARWTPQDFAVRHLPELNVYAGAAGVPADIFAAQTPGHTRSWTGVAPYHVEHHLQYSAEQVAGDVVALTALGAAEFTGERAPFWAYPCGVCSHHRAKDPVVLCNAAVGAGGHPNLTVHLSDTEVFEATWDEPARRPERTRTSHALTDQLAVRLLATVWNPITLARGATPVRPFVLGDVLHADEYSDFQHLVHHPAQAGVLFRRAQRSR